MVPKNILELLKEGCSLIGSGNPVHWYYINDYPVRHGLSSDTAEYIINAGLVKLQTKRDYDIHDINEIWRPVGETG